MRQHLERQGYTVDEEYASGGGKTVDVHGKRGDDEIWVDVETGRSDVAANIAKLAALSGTKALFVTDAAVRASLPAITIDVVTPTELARLMSRSSVSDRNARRDAKTA